VLERIADGENRLAAQRGQSFEAEPVDRAVRLAGVGDPAAEQGVTARDRARRHVEAIGRHHDNVGIGVDHRKIACQCLVEHRLEIGHLPARIDAGEKDEVGISHLLYQGQPEERDAGTLGAQPLQTGERAGIGRLSVMQHTPLVDEEAPVARHELSHSCAEHGISHILALPYRRCRKRRVAHLSGP
jgi:hypothetical protein